MWQDDRASWYKITIILNYIAKVRFTKYQIGVSKWHSFRFRFENEIVPAENNLHIVETVWILPTQYQLAPIFVMLSCTQIESLKSKLMVIENYRLFLNVWSCTLFAVLIIIINKNVRFQNFNAKWSIFLGQSLNVGRPNIYLHYQLFEYLLHRTDKQFGDKIT